MGRPAAKKGDRVTAIDTHIVLMPSPSGPVATPMPLPFDGPLDSSLSTSTFIDDEPAAMEGSEAHHAPPHVAPGNFASQPSNVARMLAGSSTVFIDGRRASRHGDPALTCNDPTDAAVGTVHASGTVIIE